MTALGERQIVIDCDVLQADGGTRTASITGGFVALHQCIGFMKKTGHGDQAGDQGSCRRGFLRHLKGEAVLDLDYDEDSTAETDANFVLTGRGRTGGDSGHGRRRALHRRAVRADAAAGAQGHRRTGRHCRSSVIWRMKLPRGATLVVASHNPGKVREIRRLLGAASASQPIGAGELELARAGRNRHRPSPPMPN